MSNRMKIAGIPKGTMPLLPDVFFISNLFFLFQIIEEKQKKIVELETYITQFNPEFETSARMQQLASKLKVRLLFI